MKESQHLTASAGARDGRRHISGTLDSGREGRVSWERVSVPGWPVTSGAIRTRTLPATPRAVPLLEEAQEVLEGELGGKGELSSPLLELNSCEARLKSFLFRGKFPSLPRVRTDEPSNLCPPRSKGHPRPSKSNERRYIAFYFISGPRSTLF